jgi:hypothetical protein
VARQLRPPSDDSVDYVIFGFTSQHFCFSLKNIGLYSLLLNTNEFMLIWESLSLVFGAVILNGLNTGSVEFQIKIKFLTDLGIQLTLFWILLFTKIA